MTSIQLLNKEMFAPLQNPSFFKSFKIEAGGYSLVWNEDIDISEYELWKNGVSKDGETLQSLLTPFPLKKYTFRLRQKCVLKF